MSKTKIEHKYECQNRTKLNKICVLFDFFVKWICNISPIHSPVQQQRSSNRKKKDPDQQQQNDIDDDNICIICLGSLSNAPENVELIAKPICCPSFFAGWQILHTYMHEYKIYIHYKLYTK